MIKAIVFDFSRVLLDVKDKSYSGSLNSRHDSLKQAREYKLFDHFELNKELLKKAEQFKAIYPLYIFTTGHIHLEPEIQSKIGHIFQEMYSLEDIGGKKDQPESFLKIAQLVNQAPNDILFIDDSTENIQVAQKVGMQTIHFENNDQLFEQLNAKLA